MKGREFLSALILGALSGAGLALVPDVACSQEIHFAPEENLEAIDAGLIGGARRSIDLAGYVMTDKVVADALSAADRRGVAIRILLDRHEPQAFALLVDLADHVRLRRSDELMHMKAFVVDGEAYRSGSANVSRSGEVYQDNDIVIVRDRSAAARFEAHFERMWRDAEPMVEFGPAVQALEPR